MKLPLFDYRFITRIPEALDKFSKLHDKAKMIRPYKRV